MALAQHKIRSFAKTVLFRTQFKDRFVPELGKICLKAIEDARNESFRNGRYIVSEPKIERFFDHTEGKLAGWTQGWITWESVYVGRKRIKSFPPSDVLHKPFVLEGV